MSRYQDEDDDHFRESSRLEYEAMLSSDLFRALTSIGALQKLIVHHHLDCDSTIDLFQFLGVSGKREVRKSISHQNLIWKHSLWRPDEAETERIICNIWLYPPRDEDEEMLAIDE
jgi:hypothetical protein